MTYELSEALFRFRKVVQLRLGEWVEKYRQYRSDAYLYDVIRAREALKVMRLDLGRLRYRDVEDEDNG